MDDMVKTFYSINNNCSVAKTMQLSQRCSVSLYTNISKLYWPLIVVDAFIKTVLSPDRLIAIPEPTVPLKTERYGGVEFPRPPMPSPRVFSRAFFPNPRRCNSIVMCVNASPPTCRARPSYYPAAPGISVRRGEGTTTPNSITASPKM